MEYLQIIGYQGSNRHQELIRAADSRRNFVLILQRPEELTEACATLRCRHSPARLSRWGINGLLEVLRNEDVARLVAECEQRPVYLFEQLFRYAGSDGNLGENAPRRRTTVVRRSGPRTLDCNLSSIQPSTAATCSAGWLSSYDSLPK